MFNGSKERIAASGVYGQSPIAGYGQSPKRIYNIVLNSNFGDGLPTASTKFYVDWTVIPQGEYKVTFSFTSVATSSDILNVANAVIYLDLGQSSTSIIEASPSSSTLTLAGTRGQFLGCLRPVSITATDATPATVYITSLYADINTNPPLYIYSRPNNSQVSVDIHTASTSQQTNYTPCGAYVLTLSFEYQC
jgi:hypothetical protein